MLQWQGKWSVWPNASIAHNDHSNIQSVECFWHDTIGINKANFHNICQHPPGWCKNEMHMLKCGSRDIAWRLFDKMPKRTVTSRNAQSGYQVFKNFQANKTIKTIFVQYHSCKCNWQPVVDVCKMWEFWIVAWIIWHAASKECGYMDTWILILFKLERSNCTIILKMDLPNKFLEAFKVNAKGRGNSKVYKLFQYTCQMRALE